MKYILVTSWPKHWDKIGGKSSFTYSMLKGRIMDPERIVVPAPAVFIKLDRETRLPQKCWKGEITAKKRTENRIWFDFRIDGTIECPPQYIGYPEGWFAEDVT